MPTQKPRITFTLSEEELAKISDYQFSHKIKNQTQAILRLLEIGLADLQAEMALAETKKSPAMMAGDEEKLLHYYRCMNSDGKARLMEQAELLSVKYQKDAGSVAG